MNQKVIGRVIKVFNACNLFNFCHPLLGYGRIPGLLIYLKIHILFKHRNYPGKLLVKLGGTGSNHGDYKGGSGLINKYAVHLIHNGKLVAPLHHMGTVCHHVIPQVIKSEFIVGPVNNICQVLVLFLGSVHPMLQKSYL